MNAVKTVLLGILISGFWTFINAAAVAGKNQTLKIAATLHGKAQLTDHEYDLCCRLNQAYGKSDKKITLIEYILEDVILNARRPGIKPAEFDELLNNIQKIKGIFQYLLYHKASVIGDAVNAITMEILSRKAIKSVLEGLGGPEKDGSQSQRLIAALESILKLLQIHSNKN